jgi:uncharacterized protein YgbK (DUF1537 family)
LFNGHLFIGDRLLSETGMKDHPLTPMTDPDIRRWLHRQTRGEVGLVPYPVVRQGSGAIRDALAAEEAAGRRLAVVDAVADDDLLAIGEAVSEAKLVTGGSGIALGLPGNFRKAGLLSGGRSGFRPQSGPAVAISGSCSSQSQAQVAAHARTRPILHLEPDAVMSGAMTSSDALAFAKAHAGAYPMIASTADPEEVRAAQARHGRERLAAAIESLMGELAKGLVAAGFTRLVVGGGETSGAVVEALWLDALAIGPEIDPGVPALSTPSLALALKSGNFGALDFYEKARAALTR